jgi:hypothetical protein
MSRLTDRWASAVLRVGDGRGFVVSYGRNKRAIVTAAHCLPRDPDGRLQLPPAHAASYTEERTYEALLGPLGAEPTLWAEVLFADPVADIAVLGPPDSQDFSDQLDAYEELVNNVHGFAIAEPPPLVPKRMGRSPFALRRWVYFDTPGRARARFLTLDGRWEKVEVVRHRAALSVKPGHFVASGTSGSPILSLAGTAIGVAVVGTQIGVGENVTYSSDGNPILVDCLPGWYLRRQ